MKKRILVYSWLIFLVSFAATELFNLSDIDSLNQIDVPIIFTRSLYIFSLTVAIYFMVVAGIVELRKYGFKLRFSVMPIIGFFIFISIILICISASIESANLIDRKELLLKPNPFIAEYENKLAMGKLTAEQTHVMSKSYARNKYTDLGVIVEYQNQNGANVIYSPTQEEINYRENFLVEWAMAKLQHRIDREVYLEAAFVWSFILISAIIFGVSFPIVSNESNPIWPSVVKEKLLP